ncbi:MAG: VWA domain-containing protein [Acidiferrobacterales bacterium]
MKQLVAKALIVTFGLFVLVACTSKEQQLARTQGVYMLIDTSGTYAKELDKALAVINYLLGTLNPGDTLAVARVSSRSFSEKDIIAKATFIKDPIKANQQKRAFRDKVDKFAKSIKRGTAYTDITGGIIQAAEFLNEANPGRKTVLIFSDMQEELGKGTVRDFPIELSGIRFVALNVTKLKTDNVDPRRYMGRLEWWQKRVTNAGATEWRVVNDLAHLERVFAI